MIGVEPTWAEEWPAICWRFRWPAWHPADAIDYFMMTTLDELLVFIAAFDVMADLRSPDGRLPDIGHVMGTRAYQDRLSALIRLAEAAGVVSVPCRGV